MKRSYHAFLLGLFILSGLYASDETFKLIFDRAQDLQVAGQTVPLAGEFTSDQYWIFGQQGLSLPAATLLSQEAGTVFFRFRLQRPETELLLPRYLLTLRTRSRLNAGWAINSGEKNAKWSFSFTDRSKTMRYQSPEALEYNKEYAFAFTYDGSTVRIYQDGKLLSEAPQPLPMATLGNLNIGPYKDGWYAPKGWGNDCQAKELRLWNRALSPAEMAGLCGVEFTPLHLSQPPLLSVPRLVGAAPVVDGELNEGAWHFAASMPSLIYGQFKEKSGELPPHGFALTYDDQNLYLGFRTIFPGGTSIQAGGLREANYEPEVWGTESFEFYITIADRRYRFGGNVAGGYVEWLGVDSKWNGTWTYKSTLKMRIDDSQLWQGEVAIPWKTLELSGPPKETVKFNFCRSWKVPKVEITSSLNLIGKTYGNPEEHVDLVFLEEAPVMQILEQSNPNLGDYKHEIALAAKAGGALRYRLELGHLDGSSQPLPIYDRVFQLKPEEYMTDKLDISISNTGYDCLVYSLARGNQVYMREIVPFQLQADYFTIQALFLSEKIPVKVRLPMLRNKFGADFSGTLLLTAPDKKVLFRQTLAEAELVIPFSRQNQAGEYRIDLLNDRNGEVIYSQTLNYPGIGEWARQDFDEERIIPPFTPLQYSNAASGLTVSMWGRDYTWKNSVFPSQIRSQNRELLTAPIALLANGKELHQGVYSGSKTAAHRGEFQMQADSAEAQLAGNSWIEYDGVVWNQLEITPKTALNDVKIRIRMPAGMVKFLHGSGGGGWGSRTTARLHPGERFLRYYPVLWVGMEDKGLCFFTETRKNWSSDKLKTFRFFKDDNETIIEINLAAKLKAGEPFRFDFGLLASPVRPLPENYPLNTLGWSHMSPLNRPGQRPVCDVTYIATQGGGGDLGSFFGDQDNQDGRRQAAALDKELARIKPFGCRPIPYTCAMYLSAKYPEMAAFKDEWGMVPEIAMDYNHTGHYVYGCCPSTGASDFFVYRYKKMLERFELSGIYFDFGLIPECNNKLHGCEQRFPLLGMREFYRRIALAQLEAGIKEPILVIHNTDHVQLPALTFTTHLLNGEQVRQASSSTLHDKKDILDSYELVMFASELSTMPFGITNSVYMPADKLAERYGGDEEDEPYKFRQTKAILAAILPHNTFPCLWRTHYGIYDKVVRFYDRFDVPKAKFHGYWDVPARLIKGQNVIISVYRHASEKKILAVIGHIGKEHLDQDVEIAFDLNKLGLSGLKTATDLMTAPDPDYEWLEEAMKKYRVPRVRAPLRLGEFGTKVIAIENNALKLHLPFHTFALVELNE
jgi:hypothetical protein